MMKLIITLRNFENAFTIICIRKENQRKLYEYAETQEPCEDLSDLVEFHKVYTFIQNLKGI